MGLNGEQRGRWPDAIFIRPAGSLADRHVEGSRGAIGMIGRGQRMYAVQAPDASDRSGVGWRSLPRDGKARRRSPPDPRSRRRRLLILRGSAKVAGGDRRREDAIWRRRDGARHECAAGRGCGGRGWRSALERGLVGKADRVSFNWQRQ